MTDKKESLLQVYNHEDMIEYSTCFWMLCQSDIDKHLREYYLERLKAVMKTPEDLNKMLKQIEEEKQKKIKRYKETNK